MAIDDLIVLEGDTTTPLGYTKIDKDLNEGARGSFLYFAYHNGPAAPITDIQFIYGNQAYPKGYTDPQAPDGTPYKVLKIDLNKGAKGRYIYACTTTSQTAGSLITQLDVISGDSPDIEPDPPFQRIDFDLNLDASGKYIFLCISRG